MMTAGCGFVDSEVTDKAENRRLKTVLCGLELDNPVIPASGTFGFG